VDFRSPRNVIVTQERNQTPSADESELAFELRVTIECVRLKD